ncbi:MAG TPA: DUF1003 domain-containing protein [Verrucomicrobiae bacterium]|nr:DUF1003 domain-containing protein [Verrucomicrobiae bacterium]
MDEQVLQLAEQLPPRVFLKLSERERRVITGVAKRTPISRDVNRTFAEKQTLGDRLADQVASFGGSWTFITLCLVALIAWTAFNSVVRAWQVEPFDPYPYLPQPHSFHAGRAAGSDHLDVPEPPGGARPSSRRPGL